MNWNCVVNFQWPQEFLLLESDQKSHGITCVFNQGQWKNFSWITFKRTVWEKIVAWNYIHESLRHGFPMTLGFTNKLYLRSNPNPPSSGGSDIKEAKKQKRPPSILQNLFSSSLYSPIFLWSISRLCGWRKAVTRREGNAWQKRDSESTGGFSLERVS